MSDFRVRATDAVRLAGLVTDPLRKAALLECAEKWLRLAQHEETMRDLKAKVEELTTAES